MSRDKSRLTIVGGLAILQALIDENALLIGSAALRASDCAADLAHVHLDTAFFWHSHSLPLVYKLSPLILTTWDWTSWTMQTLTQVLGGLLENRYGPY
jgi:hypothetical protein